MVDQGVPSAPSQNGRDSRRRRTYVSLRPALTRHLRSAFHTVWEMDSAQLARDQPYRLEWSSCARFWAGGEDGRARATNGTERLSLPLGVVRPERVVPGQVTSPNLGEVGRGSVRERAGNDWCCLGSGSTGHPLPRLRRDLSRRERLLRFTPHIEMGTEAEHINRRACGHRSPDERMSCNRPVYQLQRRTAGVSRPVGSHTAVPSRLGTHPQPTSFSTTSPATSVSRKSRPWKR